MGKRVRIQDTAPVEQQTLFDVIGTPSDNRSLSNMDDEDLIDDHQDVITRDMIYLADVAVAQDNHVKMLEVSVPGLHGREIRIKPGKIFFRMGPHPEVVSIGGTIVPRNSVTKAADRSIAKPVMCSVITTILYDNGVVQNLHIDVLHAILSIWHKRYKDTGASSGSLSITKNEIADILKITKNGHTRQAIEDALETVQGLSIAKLYVPPADCPAEQRYERIGGIISNFTINKSAGGVSPKGGARPDVIKIDLNPALVRALCGDVTDRPWILKPLNLTRNLSLQSVWKRQLERAMLARFGVTGYFQIPLAELWENVLGQSAEDRKSFPSWRKVRWKLKKCFKEWEDSGLIANVSWEVKGNRRRTRDDGTSDTEDRTVSVDVTGKDSLVTVNPPPTSTKPEEWVRCEPGPEYLSEHRSQSKIGFATQIARATCDTDAQVDSLLGKIDSEHIIEVGYRRLRKLVTGIGDRIDRLRVANWLSPNFPVPTRYFAVMQTWKERQRKQRGEETRDMTSEFPAPFATRRTLLITRIIGSAFTAIDIPRLDDDQEYLLSCAESTANVTVQTLTEVVECYRIALNQLVTNTAKLHKDIIDPAFRIANPAMENDWRLIAQEAALIATRSAAQVLWFNQLASRDAIRKLPAVGEKIPSTLSIGMAQRYSEPWNLAYDMMRPDSSLWETYVGSIYMRRLTERYVEENEIKILENRLTMTIGKNTKCASE